MSPGRPDDLAVTGVSGRLAEQIAALETETTVQRDQGAALVQALTDQLAAGQGETLYGLHSAAAALRRRGAELQEAVGRIPDALGPQLEELLSGLTERLRQEFEDAAEALRAELAEAQLSLKSSTSRGRTATSDAARKLEGASAQLSSVAAAAAAGMEAAAAAAAADLETLGAGLVATALQALDGITQAGLALTADAGAAAEAFTAVGENVIDRLLAVLDHRDQQDRLLEDRLTARVERLTKKTETTVTRLIGDLAAEADQLRRRDAAERAATAQQLHDLLDRLLSLPRGKLKELRAETIRTHQEDGT